MAVLAQVEFMRECVSCGREGLCSPDSRSEFRHNGSGGFSSSCWDCLAAQDEARELLRIDEWEFREAAGEVLPSYEEVHRVRARSMRMVPAGPFQRFLRDVIRVEGSVTALAKRVGSQSAERNLRFWLRASELDECVVDRFCTWHGGSSLAELYGGDYEEGGRVVEIAERRRVCADPECSERVRGEDRFCEFHAERLARVRAELEGDAARFRATIGSGRKPRCCNPSCDSPRPYGEKFCVECRDSGWDQDD